MPPNWSRSGLAAVCQALRAAGAAEGLAARFGAVAEALKPALGGGRLHACLLDRGRGGVRVVPLSAWCAARGERASDLALGWSRGVPLLDTARGQPGVTAVGPEEVAVCDRLLPGRLLALRMAWSGVERPPTALAAQVLEALLEPLGVLVRGALLAESLRRWREELLDGEPGEAGTFLFTPRGERLGSTRGGERLLAAVDMSTAELADLLVSLAATVGRGGDEPAGLDESHRVLPLRGGGQLQAIFRRLEGEPPRVLLLLQGAPVEPPPQLLERLGELEALIAVHAAQGLSNRQIGVELGLSPDSVKRHLGRVYRKLDVSGRLQLPEALLAP